jgi:hypothetical protein
LSGLGFILSLTEKTASAASPVPNPIPVTGTTLEDIKRTSWWTDADFVTLDKDASDLKMNPPDYLLMMNAESKLSPSAKNPLSGAVGLNQLTSAANYAAGITEEFRVNQYDKLSVAEQLPYVKRYFSNMGWTKAGLKYDNASQVWQANFAPGTMLSKGTGPDVVMYSSGPAYEKNKGLDVDKKGYITVRDLTRHLFAVSNTQLYKSALARLRAVSSKDYGPILPV